MYKKRTYYFFITSSLRNCPCTKKMKTMITDTNEFFLPLIFVRNVYTRFQPRMKYNIFFWYLALLPIICLSRFS
ncbi:hypothetical protein GDO78_012738 [Eleutherodactylus coqui]|uniref:Uncharacterized protein n=1 Tax=Eleutherodactylus coqui TaxID=57060 RepID=A0A8J6F0J3_ELECQ|nr:hypothetical protein GDO78_012738 [Eleutherodactylus coqui]